MHQNYSSAAARWLGSVKSSLWCINSMCIIYHLFRGSNKGMVNDAIRILASNSCWTQWECLECGSQEPDLPGPAWPSRQLSVLSEFLLSAKIVRNGASGVLCLGCPCLACCACLPDSHHSGYCHSVLCLHDASYSKGWNVASRILEGYWIERRWLIMRTLYWNIWKAHLKKDTNF